MISRFEWLYIRSRIEKIKNILFTFEMDQKGLYSKWQKYIDLPQQRKEKLSRQWDQYYRNCAESPSGKLFWSVYKDFKLGNFSKAKEKAKSAREVYDNSSRVPKPSSLDPEELRRKMDRYFRMKSTLSELEHIYKEYLSVYGKQKEVLQGLE